MHLPAVYLFGWRVDNIPAAGLDQHAAPLASRQAIDHLVFAETPTLPRTTGDPCV